MLNIEFIAEGRRAAKAQADKELKDAADMLAAVQAQIDALPQVSELSYVKVVVDGDGARVRLLHAFNFEPQRHAHLIELAAKG